MEYRRIVRVFFASLRAMASTMHVPNNIIGSSNEGFDGMNFSSSHCANIQISSQESLGLENTPTTRNSDSSQFLGFAYNFASLIIHLNFPLSLAQLRMFLRQTKNCVKAKTN